ncbi:helix-turn-helix domain-containing protein [Nocardioides sp.]|uniref:helix-turn-helix domain-containing protein n=1 Tax=Nocardioides sp. TaxID=35761 RepID=UPI0035B42B71
MTSTDPHQIPVHLLTEEEIEWMAMGPFDGGIPGLVRRIRRILEVSQRGLAEILGVSQSVVARWETERTSPRASVLRHLLWLAGLRTSFHDEETGEEVGPMRDDGARQHGGSRYPAHGDLTVRGWWVPRHLRSTSIDYYRAIDRSRKQRDPGIRCTYDPHWRAVFRAVWGTPDDHPSVWQLAAEAEHLDEVREQRRRGATLA